MSNKLEKGMNLIDSFVYLVPTGSHLKTENNIFDPSQIDPLTDKPIDEIKRMEIVDGERRGGVGVFDMKEVDPETHESINDKTITMPMSGEHEYSFDAGKTVVTRGWDFYDSLESAQKAVSDIGKEGNLVTPKISSFKMGADIAIDGNMSSYQRERIAQKRYMEVIEKAGLTLE